jgi:hypothetical protein
METSTRENSLIWARLRAVTVPILSPRPESAAAGTTVSSVVASTTAHT